MPLTVVQPRKVADFEKFAKLGQRNQKLEQKIPIFLAQLIDTTSLDRVKALCDDQLSWLRENYAAGSMPNRVTKYRKAIQACFNEYPIPEGLSVPQKTTKGMIDVHVAMKILFASAEESAAVVERNIEKTNTDQDNAQPFALDSAVAAAEAAVKSDDWHEAAAAMIFACQARPVDLVKLAEVEAVSRYKIRFTTKAKKKGTPETRNIYTIVRADLFVDAFARMRREPSVIALQKLSNSAADSRVNTVINRKVVSVFGGIIAPPATETVLSAHNLRAAGAKAAYHLYAEKGVSLQRFVELQLIHDSKASSSNYDDYYCVDEQGKEITAKALRADAEEPLKAEPRSTKRTTLTLDKQLLAEVSNAEEWGEGSHADRLIRIVAKAKQAKRVEAQLARECEKRQRLELQLKQLQEAQAKPSTNAEPVATAEPKEEGGFDWRAVPNAELNGDRRNDAYPEKLRRSVEAVQEYNAGLETEEQYRITGSLLRQLAKVTPKLVSQWMQAHEAELNAYTEGAGHKAYQNKGKADPRSVIKWSEGAYGKYEW